MIMKVCGVVLILLLAQESSANEFISWSDKTICRLLSDSLVPKQEPYFNEAVSRGLGCIPDNLVPVSKDKAAAYSIDNTELKASNSEADLELIKAKAKSKSFGLFNNPGKEIEKLLSEGKVIEAYYTYTYNAAFFRQKGMLGGKLNSVKFKPQLVLLAASYYQKDLLMMASAIENLNDALLQRRNVTGWAEVQITLENAELINQQSHDGSAYSPLINRTSQKYRLGTLLFKVKYHYRDQDEVEGLFIANAFAIGQDFFDVYPKVYSKSKANELLKLWINKLDAKERITSDYLKTYGDIYDFKA